MDAFFHISQPLGLLEEKHRRELSGRFYWTEALRDCITGSVQFGAIDGFQRNNAARLPVVAAIGINYTQGGGVDPLPWRGGFWTSGGLTHAPLVVVG